jgi:two-component system response regulator FlrC
MSLRVLIMEDQMTIRLAIAHALTSRGAQVQSCASLEAALDAIRRHAFDVILADLSLHGQDSADGLELLTAVRERDPEVCVIIMTAYGTDEVEAAITRQGGIYWAKSRDLEELVRSVTSVPPRLART